MPLQLSALRLWVPCQAISKARFAAALASQAISKRRFTAALAMVAGLGLLLGCSKNEPAAVLVPAVKVFEVGTSLPLAAGTYAGSDGAGGPLTGPNLVPGELRSELSGTVIEVLVKPGEAVRAGQSLLRLDPRDAKLANSAAEVQLQAARAKLANVEADFSRYTELLKKGFISKAEWDRREALLIAERAQFEVTLDQLGVYTLRAPDPGVVRRVLAKKSQVVEVAEPVIELQLRQLSKARPREAPPKQLAKQKGTEPSQAEVFRIPLTALLEGRSVMRLVPNNDQFLVEPTAVNVVEATESYALVEGLLKGDSIVAVGAHLLSPGQKVRRLTP